MVIAIVNDYKIEEMEYEAELYNVLHQMCLEEPNEEAKRRAVEQLIDAYLLLQEAKSSSIEIENFEIEDEFLDLTLKFDSKEDFDNMLNDNNLTYDKMKDRIRDELLIKRFVKDTFPPPNEIPLTKLNEIYNENKDSFTTQEMIKASHILIKGNDTDSLEKITKIKKTINCPEDFFSKVEELSECPSCCSFGDLGYFGRGKMVKAFEDVAFKLKIHEISNPVKTQFGYHLIMVTDKKKSKLAAFDEVKEALIKRLKQIDSELQMIRYIKKLRNEAEIYINHDFFK